LVVQRKTLVAFSNFQTISEVQKIYGIKYEDGTFIVPTGLAPSEAFLNRMRIAVENIDVFSSEGSRTELVISPVLLEIYLNYLGRFSFWIQKPMSADPILSGVPDYIFGTKSPLGKTVLESPLVLIVKAKKNDFEQGWAQCLAELVAAQKINNTPEKPVFGIVTDGERWQFGKLTEQVFTKNAVGYATEKITELFGAIDFVLQSSL